MVKKGRGKKTDDGQKNDERQERIETPVFLTSAQEISDALRMSLYQFQQLVRRYPFSDTGVSGKIMGRWRITQDDAFRWFRYVQKQECRHPDSRRMRPEEAPALEEIKGR